MLTTLQMIPLLARLDFGDDQSIQPVFAALDAAIADRIDFTSEDMAALDRPARETMRGMVLQQLLEAFVRNPEQRNNSAEIGARNFIRGIETALLQHRAAKDADA